MKVWRAIFFGVNSTVCLGWIGLCTLFVAPLAVDELGENSLAVAVVVGVGMASPAVVVLVGEWLLFARRWGGLERPLGVVAGLGGALALFAFVANAGEAIMKGGSAGVVFWLGFGGACVVIAAYGFWCCWLRVRRKTFSRVRGFDVIEVGRR